MLLTLAACASAPALEFPTGERSVRIPLNTPMPTPQWASAAPIAAAAMPAAVSPTPGTGQQPAPVGAKAAPAQAPATGQDETKKLLAQDAANVIEKPPTPAEVKPTDKQLGGTVNSAKITSAGKDKKPAEATPEPKTDAKPQAKSDVVEVKPVVKAEPLPSWSANAGTTLRQTIEGWSHKEGWNVRWESELLDYPIEETFSMVGNYLDVITRVFELYKDAKRPFKVEVYLSQKLVVVKEKK